jgi:hypothetical protein
MFHDEKLYVLALRFFSLDLSSASGFVAFRPYLCHTLKLLNTFAYIAATIFIVNDVEAEQNIGLSVGCGALFCPME